MVLSGQSIRARCLGRTPPLLTPFVERGVSPGGRSFGLSAASYDVRIDQDVLVPPHGFVLASTLERFNMPNDLVGTVKDKSSWARLGLAVQNTLLDPGWPGYLTLELTNHSAAEIRIAHIKFELLDQPTEQPYRGKYYNQERGPQPARHEAIGHHDNVNHPKHYNMGAIETIEFIDQVCAHYVGDEAFSIGSALRYLARAPHKNDKLEDLRKTAWYINHTIAIVENKEREHQDQARGPQSARHESAGIARTTGQSTADPEGAP
jgi:dCTP deaminase